MVEIIVAVITGIATVVGVVVTNNRSNQRIHSQLDKSQAITDTKLEELTREVRLHNDFANRIPVLEERLKAANHRIDDLERKVGE